MADQQRMKPRKFVALLHLLALHAGALSKSAMDSYLPEHSTCELKLAQLQVGMLNCE